MIGLLLRIPVFQDKAKDNIVDFPREALPIIEIEYGPIISTVIRFFGEYFKEYGFLRGRSVKETARTHIEHNRFKAQKAKEDFKLTNEQKETLEGKITTLEEVYQILQNELLEMANNSALYGEMLKRSIFEGNYDNIKEFQQKIIDSDEAAKYGNICRILYRFNRAISIYGR